jgi:transposase
MTDVTRPNRGGTNRPRGALAKEALVRGVADGLSIRQLAVRLDRSPATVRYWLKKHGIEPNGSGSRRLHGRAGDAAERIQSTCRKHGLTTFALRSNGYYRCLRCSVDAVQRWRRSTRRRLIEEFGGACAICGFDQAVCLEFHHLDRRTKQFGFAARGITRSYESLRAEAEKCVLLCSNCHAQVEAGMMEPPGDGTAANLNRRRVA